MRAIATISGEFEDTARKEFSSLQRFNGVNHRKIALNEFRFLSVLLDFSVLFLIFSGTMTDPNHSSDEEERESEQTNESKMEEAAKARKRRLLEMKSKLHGIEMKWEFFYFLSKKNKNVIFGKSNYFWGGNKDVGRI